MCNVCNGRTNCPVCDDYIEYIKCDDCSGCGYTLINECGDEVLGKYKEGDTFHCKHRNCECYITRLDCESCSGSGKTKKELKNEKY